MAPSSSSDPIKVPILPDFEIRLQSSIQAVRVGLEQVLDALGPLKLGSEEASVLELVLAEALNNIVEHAYPDEALTGPIIINCTHLRNGLHFFITDKGRPMPDGTIPMGVCPKVDVETDDLPEGGFGWFLIQDLAKDVQYQRIEGGNQLKFRIAVSQRQWAH